MLEFVTEHLKLDSLNLPSEIEDRAANATSPTAAISGVDYDHLFLATQPDGLS